MRCHKKIFKKKTHNLKVFFGAKHDRVLFDLILGCIVHMGTIID
jgi:hypothetical protein